MRVTYEEFAAARLPALLRYALMLTGDPHTAADLVQETMVKAQLRWRRICNAEQPERYVRRMLTNTYVDLHRGSWLRRVVLRAEPAEPPPARDHAQANADRDELWALLAGLPRQQRAALVLRYYEGLGEREIADALGCPPGTVKSHLHRGLEQLRKVIER